MESKSKWIKINDEYENSSVSLLEQVNLGTDLETEDNMEMNLIGNNSENKKILDDNKELTALLKILQKPWSKEMISESGELLEGWFWKNRKSCYGWKKVFCSLVGNQIYYYKNEMV